MSKPINQSDRIKRAVRKLRDEGLNVGRFGTSKIIVGDKLRYVVTHAELLELMEKDQLTLKGIKDLHLLGGSS